MVFSPCGLRVTPWASLRLLKRQGGSDTGKSNDTHLSPVHGKVDSLGKVAFLGVGLLLVGSLLFVA
jgi:hypothetical protein